MVRGFASVCISKGKNPASAFSRSLMRSMPWWRLVPAAVKKHPRTGSAPLTVTTASARRFSKRNSDADAGDSMSVFYLSAEAAILTAAGGCSNDRRSIHESGAHGDCGLPPVDLRHADAGGGGGAAD